jgi:hydroxyethylthiazole kinase
MTENHDIIRSFATIKEKSPLVLNITNYVAMNFSANALLAIGASPIMSFYPEEMDELVAECDALVINIGCLDSLQVEAMTIAASAALKYGKPWVLDPVGIGASHIRKKICGELVSFKPSIIRGNPSEIMTLAGLDATSRGVDSCRSSNDALSGAQSLALSAGAVVSVSGPRDYITDGNRVVTVSNGSPLMSRVTAMGCTATAMTAAFAAVTNPFDAAVDAMMLMGLCGEAASSKADGTGTMETIFIDELYGFDPAERLKLYRQ